MAGIKKASVTDVFNGQSLIALFDAPADGYTASTSFSDVTASGLDLGQVVEDSTSWDGDEPSIDTIKDEQGDPIVSKVTAGTFAFSFEIADLDDDMMVKIMKATKVTGSLTSTGIANVKGVVKVVDLPVSTCPIAIFNDESNKWILFPKAKIVGNLTLSDKLWRLKVSATAEFIETKTLGTFMMGEGKPEFEVEVSYVLVNEPEGNPATQGWYELVDGEYVLTTDTTVTEGKTYYTVAE